MSELVSELPGQIYRFVDIWEHTKLEFPFDITGTNSKEDRRQSVLCQPMRATRVSCFPSVNHTIFPVEIERFKKYEDELRLTYYCYVADIPGEIAAPKLLGSDF